MKFQHILYVLVITWSSVSGAYQPIKFIPKESQRNARSTNSYSTLTVHPFHAPYIHNYPADSFERLASPYTDGEYWNNGLYVNNPFSGLLVEVSPNGHITPDYSDGLAYPDPYLITGPRAKAVAKLLYSHELFFSNYPHISAVLKNQHVRRANGLAENRLGSIRRGSPFFNYRHQYVYHP